MSRIKILAGGALSILALAAMGTSAPVASAKSPCKSTAECFGVLVEGVHLPVHGGDPLSIVSEGVVTFTGKNIVVNCPQGQLNGSIIVVKGNLQASIAGASFGGAGGCSGPGGPVSVTGGPVPGAPLTETLKTNGRAQTSGELMMKLSLDESGPGCTYLNRSMKGSYNTDEEPIVIGSKVPKFTLQPGGEPGCAKSLKLSSGSWDVTAGSPASGEGPLVFVG